MSDRRHDDLSDALSLAVWMLRPPPIREIHTDRAKGRDSSACTFVASTNPRHVIRVVRIPNHRFGDPMPSQTKPAETVSRHKRYSHAQVVALLESERNQYAEHTRRAKYDLEEAKSQATRQANIAAAHVKTLDEKRAALAQVRQLIAKSRQEGAETTPEGRAGYLAGLLAAIEVIAQ